MNKTENQCLFESPFQILVELLHLISHDRSFRHYLFL